MTPDRTFLNLLIGSWNVLMTTHQEDNSVFSSDTIQSQKHWFSDRYVQETVSGVFGGKPHNKLTLLTYNQTQKRFEYMTADDHDTVILLYTSRFDSINGAREINVYSEYLMPGKSSEPPQLITVRTNICVHEADRHSLKNFYRVPGTPEERLFLEYDYRRSSPRGES